MKGTAPQLPKGTGPVADVLAEAMADAKVIQLPADKLSLVSKLSIELVLAKKKLAGLEEDVELQKEEVKRLEERALPEAMNDIGFRDFTLSDGSKVEIETIYHAGIKVEDRPVAFKWLRSTENQGLIKAEVQVPFSRGDVDSAEILINAIRELIAKRRSRLEKDLKKARAEGDDEKIRNLAEEITAFDVNVRLEESVHWATLRAFVKEQITREEKALAAKELDPVKDASKLFPRELFGVYVFDRATVTPKKE